MPRSAILAVAFALVAPPVAAEEVTLSGGERLTGQLVEWGGRAILVQGPERWRWLDLAAIQRIDDGSAKPAKPVYFALERDPAAPEGARPLFFSTARKAARHLAKAYEAAGDAGRRREILSDAMRMGREGREAFETVLSAGNAETASARQGAARILGAAWKDSSREALADAVLACGSADVRRAAAETIRDVWKRTPEPVLAALSSDAEWRVQRAAECVEVVRDQIGVGELVSAIVSKTRTYGGGVSTRGYIVVLREQSYVKDVNALVGGLGGQALDPEIGWIRSGMSFEAKATNIRVLVTTFYQISGNYFRSPQEIEAWWAAHKDEF